MSLCVIIGSSPGITASVDVTRRLTSLSFSNVDPGGFEIASIGLIGTLTRGIRPNAEVRIMLGTEIAWHGRVNAIGEEDAEQAAAFTIDCVGYGAVLSDFEQFQMIFVDRDLSRWGPPSATRQLALVNTPRVVGDDLTVLPDSVNGLPKLAQGLNGPWGAILQDERLYDAGLGNLIGSIYYSYAGNNNINVADANWDWRVGGMDTDTGVGGLDTGSLRTVGLSGSGTFTPASSKRYGTLTMIYGNSTTSTLSYQILWSLAVYGTHGLTKRGTAPSGFYPADIATYMLSVANNTSNWNRVIGTDPLNYILYHSVYRDPVVVEKVIDDMANLLGWHWGVWEPQGGAVAPTFHFVSRPATPTFVVRRGALSQLSAPKLQLDQLYSSVIVNYQDAAGVTSSVTVTVDNPFLAEAGLTRYLSVDGGIMGGGATEATAYGNMLLALLQAAARGSGSAITPATVELPNGTFKPSALIKAGRDRVRVVDLPDAGPFDVSDSRRFDTFRVKRVESTLQDDGTLQTRIEFDGGADLMEVLQAREGVASILAGVS